MNDLAPARRVMLLLAINGLMACATVPGQRSSRPVEATGAAAGRASQRSSAALVGWISFNSEFQLYANKADIGKRYDRSCVSGRFSTLRQLDAAARRFNGKRVRLTGALLNAAWYQGGNPYGSLVENYCASDTIFIASSITAVPDGQ